MFTPCIMLDLLNWKKNTPECLVPLLGLGLLTELIAKITFAPGCLNSEVPLDEACAIGILKVTPEIWAKGRPGKAKTATTTQITISSRSNHPPCKTTSSKRTS